MINLSVGVSEGVYITKIFFFCISRVLARKKLKRVGGFEHNCGFDTFFRPHQIEFAKERGFCNPL